MGQEGPNEAKPPKGFFDINTEIVFNSDAKGRQLHTCTVFTRNISIVILRCGQSLERYRETTSLTTTGSWLERTAIFRGNEKRASTAYMWILDEGR